MLNLNNIINEHRSKHRYPSNSLEWGFFLGGLIDADGSFTDILINQPNLTICFHKKDISLAYKIKTFIKFGTISKIKNKNACKYVLTNKKGFFKLLPLLQNKLRHVEKLRRYFLLCHFYQIKFSSPVNAPKKQVDGFFGAPALCEARENQEFKLLGPNLLDNHWLSGFIDGDGSFQLKIIKRKNKKKPEIRLQLQIELEAAYKYILDTIHNQFGGYIGFRKTTQSYYYNSTSYISFIKFIHYFDHYPLCSNKYKEYVLWRKAYFWRKDIIKMQKIKKKLSLLKK